MITTNPSPGSMRASGINPRFRTASSSSMLEGSTESSSGMVEPELVADRIREGMAFQGQERHCVFAATDRH